MTRPKYRCGICGKESDPDSENEKRSIGAHIRSAHDPDGNVAEYRERLEKEQDTGSETRGRERREEPRNEPRQSRSGQRDKRRRPPRRDENVVYVVQGRCENATRAKAVLKKILRERPEVEEHIFRENNYLFVRCSSTRKADDIVDVMSMFIDERDVETFTEEAESEDSGGFLSKINPFSSSDEGQERRSSRSRKPPQDTGIARSERERDTRTEPRNEPEQKTVPRKEPSDEEEKVSPKNDPSGEVIGKTVSADNYKHFVETEGDATTMEGLMQTRQQIAKGEGLGGHDPMKWVIAIIVLLIGLGVAFMIFGDINIGSILPGIGGGGAGGGGGTIP